MPKTRKPILAAIVFALIGISAPLFNTHPAVADLLPAPATVSYTPYSRTISALGVQTSELYLAPQFAQRSGIWAPIDTRLKLIGGGLARAETVAGAITFGARGDWLLDLESDGGVLHVKTPGLRVKAPQVNGASALYEDVADDTDLRYTALTEGLKEEIILHSTSAATSVTFRIEDPDGVMQQVRETPGGGLHLGRDGERELVIPPPTIEGGDTLQSASMPNVVRYDWSRDVQGLDLTVQIDPTWLSQQTAFPIVVDPSIYFLEAGNQVTSKTGFFNSGGAVSSRLYRPTGRQSLNLLTNYTPSASATGNWLYERSLLRFNLNDLPPGSVVDSAQLEMRRDANSEINANAYRIGAYHVTRGTWLTEGALGNDVQHDFNEPALSDAPPPSPNGQLVLPLVAETQRWIDDPAGNYGVMLKITTENAFGTDSEGASFVGSANRDRPTDVPLLRVTSHIDPARAALVTDPQVDDETTPMPPRPCTDVENGCDRRYIDPLDPTGSQFNLQVTAPDEGMRENTTSFTRQTGRGSFTTINFNNVKNFDGTAMPRSGIVGVDLSLGQPNEPGRYRPCGNTQDPYQPACQNAPNPASYYYNKNFFAGGGSNFSSGLFIGNTSNRSSCQSPCQHYWGQRVQRIDIEMAAKLSDGNTDVNYIRPRFTQFYTQFTVRANGGSYGPAVGELRMLKTANGAVRLAGFGSRAGTRVGAGEMAVRAFQENASGRTSGGQGFQTYATPKTGQTGYYDTGAILGGPYTIRVVDHARNVCKIKSGVSLTNGGRLDFDLARSDFGQGMTPTNCPTG